MTPPDLLLTRMISQMGRKKTSCRPPRTLGFSFSFSFSLETSIKSVKENGVTLNNKHHFFMGTIVRFVPTKIKIFPIKMDIKPV